MTLQSTVIQQSQETILGEVATVPDAAWINQLLQVASLYAIFKNPLKVETFNDECQKEG